MPPYDPWSDPLYDTAPDHLKPLDEREDDFGFFDFAKDVVAAPFRGVAGAVEGIAELGNVFGMDYDVPENLGLGTSETVVGGLLEGITEFGTAFIPVAGWVGRGAKIAGTAGKSGKAVKLAGGLEKAAKGKGAKGWLARRGQEATAGFVADFAVMQGHEARLSDMLQQYGGLSDPITEFLKSDPDDPEVVGRLKAAVEGLGAGVVFDSLLLGVRAIFKGRKAFDDAMTKGSTKEEAAVDYNKAVDAEAEVKLSADLEEPKALVDGEAGDVGPFDVSPDDLPFDDILARTFPDLPDTPGAQKFVDGIREIYDAGLITPGQVQILDLATRGSDFRFADKLQVNVVGKKEVFGVSGDILGSHTFEIDHDNLFSSDIANVVTIAKDIHESKGLTALHTFAHELGHIEDSSNAIRDVYRRLVDEGGVEAVKKFVRDEMGITGPNQLKHIANSPSEFAAQSFATFLIKRGEGRAEAMGLLKAVQEAWQGFITKIRESLSGLDPKLQKSAQEELDRLHTIALGIDTKGRTPAEVEAIFLARPEAKPGNTTDLGGLGTNQGLSPAELQARKFGRKAPDPTAQDLRPGQAMMDDAEVPTPTPKVIQSTEEIKVQRQKWEDGKFAVSDFPHYNLRGMGADVAPILRTLDDVFEEEIAPHIGRRSDIEAANEALEGLSEYSGESVEDLLKQIRRTTRSQDDVAREAFKWHFKLKSLNEAHLLPALKAFEEADTSENLVRLALAIEDTQAVFGAVKGLGAAQSQSLRLRKYLGEIDPGQAQPTRRSGMGEGAGPGMGEGAGPGKGEGAGPGKGPGKGEGAGPDKGPGKGPGKGSGKGPSDTEKNFIDNLSAQQKSALESTIEALGGREKLVGKARGLSEAIQAGGVGGGMKALKKFQHNKWLAMYNEGFISAILSSPVTLMTNFVGPVLTSFYRPLEGAMGASLRGDSEAASDFMSEFSYVTSEFAKLFFGWGDAARVAKKSWVEDRLLLDASAGSGTMDLPGQQQRAITAANVGFTDESAAGTATNWLGTIVRLSGRALSATDSAVKTLNYRAVVMADLAKQGRKQNKSGPELAKWIESQMDGMLVDDLALTLPNLRAAAKQRGLSGSAKDEFVTNALKDREVQGRSALAARALEISRDVTQTRELKKGEAGFRELGRSTQKLVNNHPVMRPFITFVRTPVNLLSWTGERTVDPALNGARILAGKLRGVPADKTIKALSDKLGNRSRFIADLASGDPKRAAEAHGRFVAGLGFTITATALAAEGGITGGGPKDIQQRKLWEQAGWQPYSIKIGDEYFSYRRFDPFATILGVVGDMVEVNQYAPEELQNTSENLGLEVGVALARNLGSKTYLTGLMDLTGLMQDPERYAGKMLRKAGGSIVPLSGFTRSFTSTLGDDQSFREIHGVMDQIKSQIPGLSDSLMPVRNFMGEAIEKHQAWGGRATDWFLPIMHSTTTSDPINLEVKNLGHAFGPPSPTRYNLDLKALADSSGQTAYDRWMELHGEVRIKGRSLKQTLTRLINSRNYQRMSPESFGDEGSPRVSEINKVIRKFRNKAETEMMQEFPEVRTARQNRAIIQRAQHRGTSPEAIRASLFPL